MDTSCNGEGSRLDTGALGKSDGDKLAIPNFGLKDRWRSAFHENLVRRHGLGLRPDPGGARMGE
jgi:hypothetical protein